MSYLNVPNCSYINVTNDIVNDDDYYDNDGYNKTWCGSCAICHQTRVILFCSNIFIEHVFELLIVTVYACAVFPVQNEVLSFPFPSISLLLKKHSTFGSLLITNTKANSPTNSLIFSQLLCLFVTKFFSCQIKFYTHIYIIHVKSNNFVAHKPKAM